MGSGGRTLQFVLIFSFVTVAEELRDEIRQLQLYRSNGVTTLQGTLSLSLFLPPSLSLSFSTLASVCYGTIGYSNFAVCVCVCVRE